MYWVWCSPLSPLTPASSGHQHPLLAASRLPDFRGNEPSKALNLFHISCPPPPHTHPTLLISCSVAPLAACHKCEWAPPFYPLLEKQHFALPAGGHGCLCIVLPSVLVWNSKPDTPPLPFCHPHHVVFSFVPPSLLACISWLLASTKCHFPPLLQAPFAPATKNHVLTPSPCALFRPEMHSGHFLCGLFWQQLSEPSRPFNGWLLAASLVLFVLLPEPGTLQLPCSLQNWWTNGCRVSHSAFC